MFSGGLVQAYCEKIAPLLRAIEDAKDIVQGAPSFGGSPQC